MFLFGTVDPHPPTATPILGQSPKKVVFTRKFGTLDPHLSVVWDKVPKKPFFWTSSLRGSGDPRRKWEEMGGNGREREKEREREGGSVERCCFCLQNDLKEQ